jgi:hypothetical protein
MLAAEGRKLILSAQHFLDAMDVRMRHKRADDAYE